MILLSKPKLWTKEFIIVSTINFFLTIVFYLLIVIMGVYVVNEFNASISQAGLVTGIFIIGTLIGRLFIGRSIESIGREKTLFIGIILFTLATLLYFVHYSVNFLLVCFLHGITLGMASMVEYGTVEVLKNIASGARGFNRGSIYTRSGKLVASVVQEGLMRPREDRKAT